MSIKSTFVTKPFLPPLEEFYPYLVKIWDSGVITNGGNFHSLLEEELCRYLNVPFISLFANGTIALITALKALDVSGEVITTPFSFIATSHALLWNNLTPVFSDIDLRTLNLDPNKIEEKITDKTSAIMPVHCYGYPCDVGAIEVIAKRYGLKVIYDAAHAFGKGAEKKSILSYGDLSVLSFHATKVFNTFEGGAIVSSNLEMKRRIDHLKNFGFEGELSVVSVGINGKMSEFNSALGLLQLKYVDEIIEKRKKIDFFYRCALNGIEGIRCVGDEYKEVRNYSYFPILVGDNYPISRDALYDKLKLHGIHARRYFYPLISDFPMYKIYASTCREGLSIASFVADRILCLPIYPDLELSVVEKIVNLIKLGEPDISAIYPR